MVKLYYVTDSGFLYASVLGVILLILMNIALVMFLFLKNTRRIENEIVPIMRGIEDMSKGVPINLSCEGELEDITYKLNKHTKDCINNKLLSPFTIPHPESFSSRIVLFQPVPFLLIK